MYFHNLVSEKISSKAIVTTVNAHQIGPPSITNRAAES